MLEVGTNIASSALHGRAESSSAESGYRDEQLAYFILHVLRDRNSLWLRPKTRQ
jgi:hypothetical protein